MDAPRLSPPAIRRRRVHRKGRFPALLPSAVASALSAVLLIVGTVGSSDSAVASHAKPIEGPAWTRGLPANTTQVVRTVRSNQWCARVYCARTEAWERVAGVWRIAKGPGKDGKAVFRSQIGARGFAPPGRRRQNDLRSPSGVFGIKVVFSTTKDRPTDMPWRRRMTTSMVSSSPGSTYNTWIEDPGANGGARRMMSWGFWIDYNNPRLAIGQGPRPIPGLGSGIFLHTSSPGRPWSATLACTQIGNPKQAEWIVRWLRPGSNPRVVNNR